MSRNRIIRRDTVLFALAYGAVAAVVIFAQPATRNAEAGTPSATAPAAAVAIATGQ